MDIFAVSDLTRRVERAALRSIAAYHLPGSERAAASAEADYADELLMLAARDLVRAVEALPESARPVGWNAAVAQ